MFFIQAYKVSYSEKILKTKMNSFNDQLSVHCYMQV